MPKKRKSPPSAIDKLRNRYRTRRRNLQEKQAQVRASYDEALEAISTELNEVDEILARLDVE